MFSHVYALNNRWADSGMRAYTYRHDIVYCFMHIGYSKRAAIYSGWLCNILWLDNITKEIWGKSLVYTSDCKYRSYKDGHLYRYTLLHTHNYTKIKITRLLHTRSHTHTISFTLLPHNTTSLPTLIHLSSIYFCSRSPPYTHQHPPTSLILLANGCTH